MRRPRAPEVPERARQERPRRAPAARCVGCETQGRPGRSGTANVLHERRGNRRRRSRRRGAATAIERRAVRPEPQAVVRSTLPEARGVSALVRTPVHGAVRSGARRSPHRRRTKCAGNEPRRSPPAGAAGQGERGEVRDEHGVQRRGEENAAVTRAGVVECGSERVGPARGGPSAANRRASERGANGPCLQSTPNQRWPTTDFSTKPEHRHSGDEHGEEISASVSLFPSDERGAGCAGHGRPPLQYRAALSAVAGKGASGGGRAAEGASSGGTEDGAPVAGADTAGERAAPVSSNDTRAGRSPD